MFDTETYIIFLFAISVFLQQAVGRNHPNHPTVLKNTKETRIYVLKALIPLANYLFIYFIFFGI